MRARCIVCPAVGPVKSGLKKRVKKRHSFGCPEFRVMPFVFSPFVFLSPVAVVTDYCLRTRSSNSTGVSTSMKQNRDMNSAPAGVFASRSDRRWRSRKVITCAPAAMARSTYMLSFGSFGCTKTDGTGSTNVAYAQTSSTNASVRAADRLSLRTRTGREATSASSARMDRLTNKLIRPDWTSLKQAPAGPAGLAIACRKTLQSKTDRTGGSVGFIGNAPHRMLLHLKKLSQFVIGHARCGKRIAHGF